MIDKLDLTNVYLIVANRKGSIFTRQMVCGARFDQSRLNRIYASNHGSWFASSNLLEHDNCQTLSDHILVTTSIVLKEPPLQGRRKGTYLKMDVDFMANDAFKQKVKEEWEKSQLSLSQFDVRIRWDKA